MKVRVQRTHAVAVLELVELERQQHESILDTFKRMIALEALHDSYWDTARAAARLDVSTKTVTCWMRGYDGNKAHTCMKGVSEDGKTG